MLVSPNFLVYLREIYKIFIAVPVHSSCSIYIMFDLRGSTT